MAGIHRPTAGTVTTDGRISALLELGAGFHPDLTGRENIYLNATILGPAPQARSTPSSTTSSSSPASRSSSTSPVKHLLERHVRAPRASRWRCTSTRRSCIIDEVIAVGDEEFQRRCFDHLYNLRSQGVTIVMVTHGLGLVQTMCDDAAWLDHGVLQAEGAAVDVVHEYLDKVNAAENERLEAADKVKAEPTPSPEQGPPVTVSPARRSCSARSRPSTATCARRLFHTLRAHHRAGALPVPTSPSRGRCSR